MRKNKHTGESNVLGWILVIFQSFSFEISDNMKFLFSYYTYLQTIDEITIMTLSCDVRICKSY